MISLINKSSEMENNPPKLLNKNSQEAAELLGFSSSDSVDSPSFSHFQAPKQKRKVRFKKPFRSSSRLKSSSNPPSKTFNCRVVEGVKILSLFFLLAIVAALLWYVMNLSQRIQELQNKFADIEAGNRNTPEVLHMTHSKLKQLDSNVTILFTEVRKNIANIGNLTLEVKQLKVVTNDLKESLAAAPALQELPKNVHGLSESVANFGSKMNAFESNLKELKDQQSNIQTTAQNLSGELDSLKLLLQEYTNSTDTHSRSSVNVSASQNVQDLESKLTNVVDTIDKMNSTITNHLIVYNDLPTKIDTINEAMAWITKDSHTQNSILHSLKTFVETNLTSRLKQLEAESDYSLKSSVPLNIENSNKTLAQTVAQLIDQNILYNISNDSNTTALQSLEKTHDLLVLLAAFLRKFEKIPRSYVLSNENATKLIEDMLQQSFHEMILSRDIKIQQMELDIKNISTCISGTNESKAIDDLTTPLFIKGFP